MPTPYQNRVIKRLCKAVSEYVFIGAQMPEEHAGIEKEYERAQKAIRSQFDNALFFDDNEKELLYNLLYEETQVPRFNRAALARQVYEKIKAVD